MSVGSSAQAGRGWRSDLLHRAVRESAALSSRRTALLEEAAAQDTSGVARALLVWSHADAVSEAEVKAEVAGAFKGAKEAGGREASLVYGIFLAAMRQWRLTAQHLLRHFASWPADETAGLLLGAFHAGEEPALRAAGDALVEQQYAVAGPESWPWASWLAWTRAEQGRVEEAVVLAEHALGLHARAGVAAHARAHADHELGAGPEGVARVDAWLAATPEAVQVRHLNWHAALASLASGDFAAARSRAGTVLHTGDVGMRAAVGWRLLLAGQEPAGLTDLERVRALLAGSGGMAEVFHTFNFALALACEGAVDDLTRLARTAAGDDRPAYRDVLAPVTQALAHVCAGFPHRAVDLLSPLLQQVEDRLGGVRVEREIVTDTLARALADTGDHQRAAHLLEQRTARRTHHRYEDLLLAPRTSDRDSLSALAS